jgi:hypothetical protein
VKFSTINPFFTFSVESNVADPELDPEGFETYGRIWIRSGTEINISDPDSNPIQNHIRNKPIKRALYLGHNKIVSDNYVSHFQKII